MHTVIVGAGAAGCVLAARLTERTNIRVTLIEAGPDYHPSVLPHDLADGRQNALVGHDWGFKHRPNLRQRLRFPLPRGRVVGGSSAINTCIALRGQPEDYAEWEARGLSEWSADAVAGAFARIERDLDFGDQAGHGNAGPLPLRRHTPDELTPWQAAFVEAATALGYPACADSNASGALGVGPHAMNKLDGRRISAAEAWLTDEVRARENFALVADTRVVRVAFDGRRATGVVVRDRSGEHTVDADRVLLCGGSIMSPMVLWRSGVGPRLELDALGVDVVADNPAVAGQLLDHPGCAMFFKPRRGVVHPDDPLIQAACRYTSEGGTVPGDVLLQPGSKVAFPRVTFRLCSIMSSVGKPKGKGRLVIRSLKPGARPTVLSGLLDHPEDRAIAVDAMERARELAAHPAMSALATHLWPSRRTASDRASLDHWIRLATDSGYHPCGTVPMGSDDDPNAATDGSGRVRGVDGLFVADASLMPTIPSSNIHLPTLMMAERLAELLGAPG